MWTDSEIYTDNKPKNMRPKMAANAAATIVCVSCGWVSLGDEAEALVWRASDFDQLCDAMPGHLRRATVKIAACWQPWRADQFTAQTILLVGFSKRHDRVLSYVLCGSNFFEPALVSRLSIPSVDTFDTLKPKAPVDLLPGARVQMDHIRMSVPDATGGDLVVALVRPGLVIAGPVAELTPPPPPSNAPLAPEQDPAE